MDAKDVTEAVIRYNIKAAYPYYSILRRLDMNAATHKPLSQVAGWVFRKPGEPELRGDVAKFAHLETHKKAR